MADVLRVYVAGPYTAPDPEANVRAAIEAAHQLRDAGAAPFVPHLCHFWHAQQPRGYEDWMAYDLAWLKTCHLLVRLPGDSPGADREVAWCHANGVRVCLGLTSGLRAVANIIEWRRRGRAAFLAARAAVMLSGIAGAGPAGMWDGGYDGDD